VYSAASVRDQHQESLRFYKAEGGSLHELQVVPATQLEAARRKGSKPLTLHPSPL
jgi:hypothetical protein